MSSPAATMSTLMDAIEFVRAHSDLQPRAGIVLGSGLGAFASRIDDAVRIPYAEIPGFHAPAAEGHAGQLVLGRAGDAPVACLAGRIHQYEGHSAQDVVFGVRLLGLLGVKDLVLTNAAGSINPSNQPGSLVLIADHINMQGTNPLIGPNLDELGPRFPDMTEAYPAELRGLAREAGLRVGLHLSEGVYMALLGPSFETPAEIRAFRALGADLVGMSTVPEVIAANHMGLRCLGISCVTNLAAGLSASKLSHQEVLDTGNQVREQFEALLLTLLPMLGQRR
ncbi:MAG: purine-nucleoside phosphorylase [Bryobacterales bacterium]|nr:purine-nucleoside phosphorylase [Bryobacterales bacterium]